jgi:hypothetical protein
MQHWALGHQHEAGTHMPEITIKTHPFKLQASLRALADSFSEGTLDSEEKYFDAASYMTFARLSRRLEGAT